MFLLKLQKVFYLVPSADSADEEGYGRGEQVRTRGVEDCFRGK